MLAILLALLKTGELLYPVLPRKCFAPPPASCVPIAISTTGVNLLSSGELCTAHCCQQWLPGRLRHASIHLCLQAANG